MSRSNSGVPSKRPFRVLIVDHLCQSRYLADITRESNISPPPSDEQQEPEWHPIKDSPLEPSASAPEEPSSTHTATTEEEIDDDGSHVKAILSRFAGDETLASYNCNRVISVMCDGFVLQGIHPSSQRAVALKLKEWPMEHPKITEMFKAIQQREVAFNQLLMEEDPEDSHNLCRFLGYWEKQGDGRGHTAMVFEMLEGTWSDHWRDGGVLDGKRNIRRLRRELRAMLEFLAFLERLEIIHGDIKPENEMRVMRAIDLDCALMVGEKSDVNLCSMNYRAPEIFLSIQPYTAKVDVFALGMVALEFYLGRPGPLLPGHTAEEQLRMIVSLMGPLPSAMVSQTEHQALVASLPSPFAVSSSSLETQMPLLKGDDKEMSLHLRDLIAKMLAVQPQHRISASSALGHAFFSAA